MPDVLSDLVASGLAERLGGRRYARYRLTGSTGPAADPHTPARTDRASVNARDAVVAELTRSGRLSAADLARRVGRSRPAVLATLRELVDEGLVRADGAATSPRRSYVWLGPANG